MEHGREHARRRGDLLLARIGERETAGAISRLQHAGPEAGLTVGGGLLIAGDASDRKRHAEMLRRGLAIVALGVANLREHGARHVEPVEQPLVPLPGPDVVEHGACGVRGVGRMQPAAGQPEHEKAVDGPEANFASARPRRQSWNMTHRKASLVAEK